MTERHRSFTKKDLAEITIGSLVLAFPVAVTEEVWDLSEELSLLRVLMISLGSLVILSVFVYAVYRREGFVPRRRDFYTRVGATYGVTLPVCAALLGTLDRLELVGDPVLAVKRMVLVAFPACFAATVVDSIG